MKDKIYDAIIIGAGPAGASLAYFLSGFDLNVALIEKKKNADMPVRCAEFVPRAITMLYNDKIKGINNEVSHMETYIKGKLAGTISSQGYILDRNVFVVFLIKEFEKKGGTYLSSCGFLGASFKDDNKKNKSCHTLGDSYTNPGFKSNNFNKDRELFVNINHKDRIFCLKTRILVGADGPLSRVAGIMKLLPPDQNELQTYPDGIDILSSQFKLNNLKGVSQKNSSSKNSFLIGFQENIVKKNSCENHARIFFYPYIAGGYGWLFPKKNSLNVGIAVNMHALKVNGIKKIYSMFKDELIKDKILKGDEPVNSSISGLAPVYGIRSRIVKNNIVLVGDAAGLCNPITGAGNYNAALSAKVVSEKIKNALQSENLEILKESEKEICSYFNSSISHALKKRRVLEENNERFDFEQLVKKTWVSFKEYWHER